MPTRIQNLGRAMEAARRIEDHPNLEERLQLQIDALVAFLVAKDAPVKPTKRAAKK